MAPEALIDPTGGADLDTDTTLTPRLDSLRGKTLGLLENSKPNAAVLLEELGTLLSDRYEVAKVLPYSKAYFGTPVERTQVEQIVQECDIVVTGVGD